MDNRLDINIVSILNFPNNCLCGYISSFLVNVCYLGVKGHIFLISQLVQKKKSAYREWRSDTANVVDC